MLNCRDPVPVGQTFYGPQEGTVLAEALGLNLQPGSASVLGGQDPGPSGMEGG